MCQNNSLDGGSIDMKWGADQQRKAEMKAMSSLSTTPIKSTQIIRGTVQSRFTSEPARVTSEKAAGVE